MRFIDKIFNKIGYGLLNTNIRILIVLGVFLISKNHLYINRNRIKFWDVFKLLKHLEKVSVTGTGVLILYYENTVIKYPLGEHSFRSLNNEYMNYLALKDSTLSNLVDYFLYKRKYYYISERLYPLKKSIENYREIYAQLSSFQIDGQELLSVLKTQEFNHACEIIKLKCKEQKIKNILKFLNNTKILKRCPMHGDLTKYNIMKNKKNKPVLIDLDRFKMDGVENVDRIHFLIEYYAKKKKKDFFEILNFILQYWSISLNSFYILLFYLFYRIGKEHDKNIILPSSYYDNLCKTIEHFLSHKFLRAMDI